MTPEEKELFVSPYKALDAIFEVRNTNSLMTIYEGLYLQRYRTAPIYPQGTYHIKVFQDLQKACGQRSKAIIEHFFKMDDPWFKRTGHSVSTLEKSLMAINASLGLIDNSNYVERSHFKIQKKYMCDNCFTYFDMTCDSALYCGVENIYCENCKK